MVTLASSTIRGVATTVTEPDREITNPTASNVAAQVVTVTPAGSVTLNTTDDAFQVLSDNTVAFKTDLAATTTKQINVLDVLANQYPVASPVTVSQNASTFTMSNEYYTVTVRKTQNLGSPLTPIASIVPATGSVQLTGSIHLSQWSTYHDQYNLYTYEPVLTGYTFEVLEQGPLLVKVKATYTFSHSAFLYGVEEIIPANNSGTAFASETIELRAGVNAVFLENDSDYPWVSGFDIANLDVNQLRYRGHLSDSVALGYTNIDGGAAEVYAADGATTYINAIRDVSAPLDYFAAVNHPFMPSWNHYIRNTGHFVIARNSAGAPGKYVSIIGGPASRARGTFNAGAKFIGNGTSTKIIYSASWSAASNERFRYAWAVSVDDEPIPADTSTTLPHPGVIRNQHINTTLSKLLAWVPASNSETFYTESLFLTPTQQDALIDRIKTDSAYASSLIAREPYAINLIQYIQNPTLARAEALYDEVIATRDEVLDAHWFKNGNHEPKYHFFQAGSYFLAHQIKATLLMSDLNLTTQQKADIYKAMLLFGFILGDEDFVPTTYADQFNYGNANAPVQYSGYLDSIRLMLLSNPSILSVFDAADFLSRNTNVIETYVSAYGSSKGSPHYTGTMVPVLDVAQQSYVGNVADFTVEVPRLALFAQFMMDTLTPEDSRFGGLRKVIALGDGYLAGMDIHGQLGTMFAESNPTLSKKLMESWDWMGSPHSGGTYPSSVFRIDDTLPRQSFTLADAHYPDYMSVFRSGFDTSNESAVWFVHGDWYSDHRHYDAGAMYCYLLGKPIALSWSSFYTPYVPTSLLHNGLTRVADLTWDGTGGEFSLFSGAGSGSNTFPTDSVSYTSSSTRPTTTATFDLDASTTWTRTVMLNKESVTRPVVVIIDETAGTNAAAEKILNLNLMMTGAVVTPGGNVTPATVANKASSTSKTAISSGWSTFEFTGQWDVNLILMVYNVSAGNYQLGRFSHTSSPTTETAQYLAAVGSSYVEMQYQFRLWSTANSRFVLVPWLASGSKPSVTSSGTDILVDGVTVT